MTTQTHEKEKFSGVSSKKQLETDDELMEIITIEGVPFKEIPKKIVEVYFELNGEISDLKKAISLKQKEFDEYKEKVKKWLRTYTLVNSDKVLWSLRDVEYFVEKIIAELEGEK